MLNEKSEKQMNKDGLNPEIYGLLWIKQTHNENFSFPFLLPHTVIFKFGKPQGWFFSNGNGNIFKRKEKNISIQKLLQAFTSKKSLSNIAGSYYYSIDEFPNNLYIKYITHDEIYQFLTDEGQKENGILQQFIDPEYENNSIIECTWSPNLCIFEKRVNKQKLFDLKFDLHERAVTAEGSEIYVIVEKLKSPQIACRLQFALNSIRYHVQQISYESFNITRMCAYFKVDRHQNLWFLYTNSIRNSDEEQFRKRYDQELYQQFFEEKQFKNVPLNLNKPKTEQQNIKNVHSMYTKPIEITKSRSCFRCNQLKCNVDMIDCPLSFIVGAYDQENNKFIIQKVTSQQILLQGRNRNQPSEIKYDSLKIPYELNKLYPKFTQNIYNKLKNNPEFVTKNYQICIDCYLLLVKSQSIISGVQEVKNDQEPQPSNIRQDKKQSQIRINSIINNNNLTQKSPSILQKTTSELMLKQLKQKYKSFKIPNQKLLSIPARFNSQRTFTKIDLDYIKGRRANTERKEKIIFNQNQSEFQNQTNYLSSNKSTNNLSSPIGNSLFKTRQNSLLSDMNSINMQNVLNCSIQQNKQQKQSYI